MTVARKRLAAATILTAALFGCTRPPEIAPARGQVRWRGEPLGAGTVVFQPLGGGPAATGKLQSDGRFEMATARLGGGAVVGKHQVLIAPPIADESAYPPGEAPRPVPPFPPRYSDFSTSGLTAEVRGDGESAFLFELTE